MFGKLSRDKTKWVIVSIILVVLLIGGVMLYKRIDDGVTTKRLSSLDYAVGSIDAATGKYSSDKTAIYTKEFLSAKDIKIELKENSNVSYKIFYYKEDKTFISASGALTADYAATSNPENTKYVKIVIYNPDESEISTLGIMKYAGELKVTVEK